MGQRGRYNHGCFRVFPWRRLQEAKGKLGGAALLREMDAIMLGAHISVETWVCEIDPLCMYVSLCLQKCICVCVYMHCINMPMYAYGYMCAHTCTSIMFCVHAYVCFMCLSIYVYTCMCILCACTCIYFVCVHM